MLAIFKREMRGYFMGTMGYVFLVIFLAVAGIIFSFTTLFSMSADLTSYYTAMLLFSAIVLPILTMKSFSEERKSRTEQLLLTAPVSIWGMVLGKFFAAFTLFIGSVLVSCVNFFPLYAYANAEGLNEAYDAVGPIEVGIVSSLLGIICIGMAFIAIGMFISSLTENQLAAAIITVAIIVAMLVLNLVNEYITNYAIRFVIDWVCFVSRFAPFSSGMFDPSALLYYLSVSGVFLLLTVRVYDKRRWG
jgi:ABC-2 type transport system permease protein